MEYKINCKVLFLVFFFCSIVYSQTDTVSITVDITKEKGPMKHMWAWFGYDEPNYTIMKNGKKLLSELAELSPVPVYVRTHNLMTTGDGTPALKWGSTNMYTEDKNGNPIYSWTIIDKIFDTYIELKMKPFVEIGFMPEALSINPEPYQHHWSADGSAKLETGWAYPPKDYKKWAECIHQWVRHCIDRYGKEEVESWYWEVWNEPDIFYLMSDNKVLDFCKMYDYASDAVKRALPTARIGGPNSTGGGAWFLKQFLQHCISGTNLATGKIGSPLDFISFHAKGAPEITDGNVRMGMKQQLSNIQENFLVITSFPELKELPVILGESDPEGCAACGVMTHPANAYRNGTLFSSYEAASISRIYDLADYYKVNLIGAVNWAFEFEDQPWFAGFRSLATNGVDKPVLNVFRMFGKMSGNRVEVTGNLKYDFKAICDSSVRGRYTDINAFACSDKKGVTILLWNYHDLDIQDPGSPVVLSMTGIPVEKAKLTHYRIDKINSNSYELWKKFGSPQKPVSEQITALESAGLLKTISENSEIEVHNKVGTIRMQLPRQAVSLIQISYDEIEKFQAGFYFVEAEADKETELPATNPNQQVIFYDYKYLQTSERGKPQYLLLSKTADVELLLTGNPELITKGENGFPELLMSLTPNSAKSLENLTKEHLGGKIVFMIRNEPITIHKIRSVITGGLFKISRCTDTACQYIYSRIIKK